MKKLGLVLGLGVLGVSSLFADYQLVLTAKDGKQTKQCIKSYSFSNNIASLARENNLKSIAKEEVANEKDVYSEKETMTNKVWIDGKPIYRMITTIPTLKPTYTWTYANYTSVPSNIDTFISAHQIGVEQLGATSNTN